MSAIRNKKTIFKILGILFILALILIVLMNSQCSHQISSEIFLNDYQAFFRQTKGLRNRENFSVFFTEQKAILDFEREIIFVGYADESLKHKNPDSRQELLENTFIEMIQDSNNLFCYDQEIVNAFLQKDITVQELKQLLFIGYNNESISQIMENHSIYAQTAKSLVENITRQPVALDISYCIEKDLPYKNGILQKPGISYRIISEKEYSFLQANNYPLAGFLLRENNRQIINILPNCAQGATQLLYGQAQYTKVSQLVEDQRNLFLKIDSFQKMQVGDCIAVLWDKNAGETTNSGHTGVVVDIEYDADGNVADGTLIEYFPANHAPRLVKISRSMYPDWKEKINNKEINDIFLLRAHKNKEPDFEFVRIYLKQKYPEKTHFVVF